MVVALDSKDLAILDKKYRVESVVWDVLQQGAKSITASDFVGANEVRINKMTGFVDAEQYKRNQDNTRNSITIQKETVRLSHEDWFAYDVDRLDQSENSALVIQNVVDEHRALITIPKRDKVAIQALYDASTKKVSETLTEDTILSAYDAAEEYFTDNEIPGGYVMFISAKAYRLLKNAKGVAKTFTTSDVNISGINRKVAQLDNGVPIIKVPKSRISGLSISTDINFIVAPLKCVAPIVKYGTVDVISADFDRDGYRDTIKGLDYYDAIVFDNAKSAIYVSEAPKA